MPDKDWRTLVRDMIEHARYAADHTRGMDGPSFAADLKTVHAVTRCVEIIGEAARGVPDEARLLAPEIPWARIVGARHILAHHYGRVDTDILWKLVEDGLPAMCVQLEAFLARVQ